jgi:hypothetical protein
LLSFRGERSCLYTSENRDERAAFIAMPRCSDRWVQEVNFDGYRVQNARCRIFTDAAILDRFNKIANDAFLINAVSGIIDGEVAGPAADGTDGKRTLCWSEGLSS